MWSLFVYIRSIAGRCTANFSIINGSKQKKNCLSRLSCERFIRRHILPWMPTFCALHAFYLLWILSSPTWNVYPVDPNRRQPQLLSSLWPLSCLLHISWYGTWHSKKQYFNSHIFLCDRSINAIWMIASSAHGRVCFCCDLSSKRSGRGGGAGARRRPSFLFQISNLAMNTTKH